MRIHTHPEDPILRVTCDNIVVPVIERESYEEILRGMMTIMAETKGVGLAAPQVGLAMQLALIDPEHCGVPIVMVNPIRNGLGEEWKWAEEGCLSLPGQKFRVRRRKAISVQWRTLDGRPRERRFDDWAARVVQHELDHLSGRLICDHGRPVRKKR
jgi:peptide deformylase